MPGLGSARRMEGEDVAPGNDFVETRPPDIQRAFPILRQGDVRIAVQAAGAERAHPLGDCLTDASHPDIADDASAQVARLRTQVVDMPSAPAQLGVGEGEAPQRREGKQDRMFGHTFGGSRGGQSDAHAALGECIDVERVLVSNPLVVDQPKARCRFDGCAAQRRPRDDDDLDIGDLLEPLPVVVAIERDQVEPARHFGANQRVDVGAGVTVVQDVAIHVGCERDHST